MTWWRRTIIAAHRFVYALGTLRRLPLIAGVVVCLGLNLSAAELKVGDVAPGFSLVGSDGKQYRLEDYKGKQVVVLAWFAKAFTSG
jgi:thioredoxin-dependent peroxiredoxin